MSCSEWKEYSLAEISTMKYGKMPRKDRISDEGYPIFSGYRIVGYYDEYMFEDEEIIVVARGVGGTGDVKLSPPKSYITNLSIAVQFNECIINKKFMYYKLKNENLRLLDSGSAQSQITINDLKRYKVNIPSLEEQEKIANILSSLDDKIELNNEMNKTLEEMAQIIFKRWFVDFEFPNEYGEYYKSSDGEMVDSELGMIPKGWEVKSIGDLCDVGSSKRIFMKEYVESGIPFFRGKEIIEKSKGNSISTELFITEERFTELKEKFGVPVKNDILLTSVGTLGVAYLVGDEEFYFKDGNLTWFKNFKEEVYRYYIYQWLISSEGKKSIDAITIGSTQKALTINALKSMKLVLPNDYILGEFKGFIESNINGLRSNNEEKNNLIELRDSLLPKLMCGEIRV